MSISYLKKAAELRMQDAEKAYALGDYTRALTGFQIASENYRKLSDAEPINGAAWTTKALVCERKMEEVKSALSTPTRPATMKREPPQSKTASAGQAAQVASADSAEAEKNKPDYSGYSFEVSKPNKSITFSDIVGLDEAKAAIYDKLIDPLEHPEIYQDYGLEAGGLLLLEGPPGTGKTTFSQATASVLGYPFINVPSTQLVSKYVGETETNVKNLFDEVRRFIREQNTPVILYLDEFDSIARNSGGDDKVANSVVPILKTQLQGFDSENGKIFIIASTNYFELIDSGIVDRFQCIHVPLPNELARKMIFQKKFKKIKGKKGDYELLDFDLLAKESAGMSGRGITAVVQDFLLMLAKRDAKGVQLKKGVNETLVELIHTRKNAGKN